MKAWSWRYEKCFLNHQTGTRLRAWVGSGPIAEGWRVGMWPLAGHYLVLPIPASVLSGALIWPL
jgi:hypothetical protein